MLRIYLIRHGLKEAVPFDPPLTEIGVKQAQATAKYFKNTEIKAIISSPKERTKRTAEIIATPHSLPVQFDTRLLERLEWISNVWLDDFIVEWDKTDKDRNYTPKDGKSSVANGQDIKEVLEEIAEKYPDGNILIVTHGGSLGDLLRALFGEKNLLHQTDPITKTSHINISECSITVIEKENEKYKLIKLNDTSHLIN